MYVISGFKARLLCMRLGTGHPGATLVSLHTVRRVALSQANIWSSGLLEVVLASLAMRPISRLRFDALAGVPETPALIGEELGHFEHANERVLGVLTRDL